MPANFEGFSLPDQQRMIAAYTLMKQASKKARAALLSGDLTAYKKWFEGGDTKHLMKVASIVSEIDDAIAQRPITFVNATGNAVHRDQQHLCGYVWMTRTQMGSQGVGHTVQGGKAVPTQGWDLTKAHNGSGMRVMVVPKTHNGDVGNLAETLYHELSHKVGGTWDVTYSRGTCAANATSNPGQAVSNAENFNLFIAEYL